MVKKLITTNKGIQIGRESNTLLNLLVGANSKFMVDDEIKKINYLLSNSERIDIITDLSLYKSANRLWEYVLKNTQYMAGRPCYNISKVDENGVVRARTKGRDTQGNFPESVIRICNISPGKR